MRAAPGKDPAAEVLSIIERLVAHPAVGWRAERQREYLDTVRQALGNSNDIPDYAARIDILRRAFPAYWNESRVSELTQAQYEMRRAEIRWHCETLMAEEPASASEKALVKAQFRDLGDYAAEYLMARFPFLTPEHVQAGKTAGLREFDDELEAPLILIFRRPFSQDQLKAIKANWARMYSRWFFTWRDVRYGAAGQADPADAKHPANHPHYEFVKRCMSYLPRTIWPALGTPPDYVRDAAKELNAEKLARVRLNVQAVKTEGNLAMRFRNQVEQVEQWSFVFTALLETATLGENNAPSSANPLKGGDAYGLNK